MAYIFTGKYEEAIIAFKKALNFTPNDFMDHPNLTIAYILSDREDEALAAVTEVLRINPKCSL